ncbi:hypothetical protein SCAR479_06786 [Seiridium cardinale]
MVTAILR